MKGVKRPLVYFQHVGHQRLGGDASVARAAQLHVAEGGIYITPSLSYDPLVMSQTRWTL